MAIPAVRDTIREKVFLELRRARKAYVSVYSDCSVFEEGAPTFVGRVPASLPRPRFDIWRRWYDAFDVPHGWDYSHSEDADPEQAELAAEEAHANGDHEGAGCNGYSHGWNPDLRVEDRWMLGFAEGEESCPRLLAEYKSASL